MGSCIVVKMQGMETIKIIQRNILFGYWTAWWLLLLCNPLWWNIEQAVREKNKFLAGLPDKKGAKYICEKMKNLTKENVFKELFIARLGFCCGYKKIYLHILGAFFGI